MGCNLWNNQAVYLDAINWMLGTTSCTIFDYTNDTAYLDAGMTYNMMVTNGSWCGCGVWIDFNQDYAFDTTENLFHLYNAMQTQTYVFNITIPANVATGTYRMRVIAGWGSDTYTAGQPNGFGPCGSYQNGNFDDFSAHVTAQTIGILDPTANNLPYLEAIPNPATDAVTVTIRNFETGNTTLQLTDLTGKIIQTIKVDNEKEVLDISTLSKGVYVLRFFDDTYSQSIKLVK